MTYFTQFTRIAAMAVICVASAASGQVNPAASRNEEPFSPENAILDTSVAFAIGAREGQQSLRGSFGWPSFQEGLVDGVYFRFDPDGYARFSPTPRLDLDVFEVICRPRTYSCLGRKDGLEIHLTEAGTLHLKIAEVGAGDMFFLSDGVSEIQVPERILQPLDIQLELLLASAVDLSVRRGGDDIVKTSLKGFHAVGSYLRWVAARQDYSVLPRGWPVPNSSRNEDTVGLAQPPRWEAPTLYDQTFESEIATQPQIGTLFDQPDLEDTAVSELRSEINDLKKILQENLVDTTTRVDATGRNVNSQSASALELTNLLTVVEALKDQVDDLSKTENPVGVLLQEPLVEPELSSSGARENTGAPTRAAQNLQYLMEELGLDINTAVTVMQMSEGRQARQSGMGLGLDTSINGSTRPTGVANELFEGDIIDQILQELEAEITVDSLEVPMVDMHEYQLLSDYFESAALPALRAFSEAVTGNAVTPATQ